MRRLVDDDDLIDKTIKGIIKGHYGEYIIVFQDETWAVIDTERNSDDIRLSDEIIDECDEVKLGIVTQAECDAYNEEDRRKMAQLNKGYALKEYERLKLIFEKDEK